MTFVHATSRAGLLSDVVQNRSGTQEARLGADGSRDQLYLCQQENATVTQPALCGLKCMDQGGRRHARETEGRGMNTNHNITSYPMSGPRSIYLAKYRKDWEKMAK